MTAVHRLLLRGCANPSSGRRPSSAEPVPSAGSGQALSNVPSSHSGQALRNEGLPKGRPRQGRRHQLRPVLHRRRPIGTPRTPHRRQRSPRIIAINGVVPLQCPDADAGHLRPSTLRGAPWCGALHWVPPVGGAFQLAILRRQPISRS